MKRSLLYIFAAVCTGICIGACSEDDIPANIIPSNDYFRVPDGDTILIDGKTTEGSLRIEADCQWSIEKKSGWTNLHARTSSGEGDATVTIETDENDSPTQRAGMLTITTANGIVKDVTVLQSAGNIQLTLSTTQLPFGMNGGSAEVSVTSNTSWTASGGSNWCHIADGEKTGNDTFTITVDPTTETSERTAFVSVTPTGGTAQTITVTQSNKTITLTLSPENLNFNGKTPVAKTLTVTCNDNWSASVSDDWVDIGTNPSGNGNGTLTVNCEANNTSGTRTATITVQCGSLTAKANVTQSRDDVSFRLIPAGDVNFPASGGSQTVTVVSNTPWSVTGGSDWCQIVPADTQGNGSVTITASANTEESSRSAVAVFFPEGSDPVTLNITQNGLSVSFSVTPSTLSFNAEGGQATVLVNATNTAWTASVDGAAWCHLSATQGDGSGSVTVNADANESITPRTAYITFKPASGDAVMVTATQAGKNISFTVSPTLISFNAEGGTADITVTSNVAWTVDNNNSIWCTVEAQGSDGNGTVVVTANENNTASARTAILTFRPAGGTPVEVTVNQDYKVITLSVSPAELTFSATGEDRKTISITCNDQWTLVEGSEWVHASSHTEYGNAVIDITCDPNTTGSSRQSTITVRAGDVERQVAISQTNANIPSVYSLQVVSNLNQQVTLRAAYQSEMAVTEYGFVYATHETPSVETDVKVPLSNPSTSGDMEYTLTNLTLGQTYYARAYATNASGTAYSNEVEFTVQGREPGQDDNSTPTPSRRRQR